MAEGQPVEVAVAPQFLPPEKPSAPQLPPTAERPIEQAKKPIAPKGANKSKSKKENVIPFSAPKGAKRDKKALPPKGQKDNEAEMIWIRSVLPPTVAGAWWEPGADYTGYKIKLRWREGAKKMPYIFHRLGKHEAATLKEKPYEIQRAIIADRLLGQLYEEGRRDVAGRIAFELGNHQIVGEENQAAG